jgi:hypothetical protein
MFTMGYSFSFFLHGHIQDFDMRERVYVCVTQNTNFCWDGEWQGFMGKSLVFLVTFWLLFFWMKLVVVFVLNHNLFMCSQKHRGEVLIFNHGIGETC